MQEPTNMFVLCAPIKVLPAGCTLCTHCQHANARCQEMKNQKISLNVVGDT